MRRLVVVGVVGSFALACSGGGGGGGGSGPSATGTFGGCNFGDLLHLALVDSSGTLRDFICNDESCTVCDDGTAIGANITVYYQNQPITNEAFGTMNFDVVTGVTKN